MGRGSRRPTCRRIFDAFYRARPDAAGPAGNGLGLTIARSIAERSGGSLSVTSKPGAGTTFLLSLPRQRTPAGVRVDQRPS